MRHFASLAAISANIIKVCSFEKVVYDPLSVLSSIYLCWHILLRPFLLCLDVKIAINLKQEQLQKFSLVNQSHTWCLKNSNNIFIPTENKKNFGNTALDTDTLM